MLKISNRGDDKYDVEDSSGTKIGWISDRSIGFRGFATATDAREAASQSWRREALRPRSVRIATPSRVPRGAEARSTTKAPEGEASVSA